MRKITLLFTLAATLLLFPAFAQQSPKAESGQGSGQSAPDYSVEEVMQRHGIALTTQSLTEALGHPDQEVREVAALELAARKATDAVPAMVQALKVEKTPVVQLQMAYSLERLDEKAGATALQAICDDRSAPANDRLQAAQYLLDSGKETCLRDVIEILQAPMTQDVQFQDEIEGLSLLSRFQHLSADDSQRILNTAVGLLSSSDPTVRTIAARALAQRGDKAAADSLRQAIAVEQNRTAKSSMLDSLKSLTKSE